MGYQPIESPLPEPLHYRIEYDHSWQNPESDDYDPWRVMEETPEMKNGRKVYLRPTPPPARYIRG